MVCMCVCVCVCVCVCMYALRMVSMDKILCFINTLIIINWENVRSRWLNLPFYCSTLQSFLSKGKTTRFCIGFRALNCVTKHDTKLILDHEQWYQKKCILDTTRSLSILKDAICQCCLHGQWKKWNWKKAWFAFYFYDIPISTQN